MSNVAHDWYAHAIGLQFAILEMRNEVAVDVCQESPRLVTLALAGLQAEVDQFVEAMGKAIVEAQA